jgi:hypothetical protein
MEKGKGERVRTMYSCNRETEVEIRRLLPLRKRELRERKNSTIGGKQLTEVRRRRGGGGRRRKQRWMKIFIIEGILGAKSEGKRAVVVGWLLVVGC